MNRIERIRALLDTELAPLVVEIEDESARHAGHAGARKGGHYHLRIVAAAFDGKRPLERHQLVYQVLDSLMKTEIHALSIKALTPEEAASSQ